jgi:tRNA threonylcarbamoyladenosine biosynthesis protein TsaB
MNILAVDTATRGCSVAVVCDQTLRAEITLVTRETHSKHLMTQVTRALELARLKIPDIDGYAVTRGPGSFTGLRIGISLIKGFCSAFEKPLAGISSLEALAWQAGGTPDLIGAFLDARNKEVYFSCYRRNGETLSRVIPEKAASPAAAMAAINEPCLFIGDGAVLYKEEVIRHLGKRAKFAPPTENTIRATTLARLAADRFEKGDGDDPGTFVPHYIRRSYAELNLGKQHSA